MGEEQGLRSLPPLLPIIGHNLMKLLPVTG